MSAFPITGPGEGRFFAYAQERYRILLRRRSGLPRPWTQDSILQTYRFCNVFREDDTTTRWVREKLTLKGYQERWLGALLIARWFNRVETLARLLPPKGEPPPYYERNLFYNWSAIDTWKDAVRDRLNGVHPLVTGAYIIKTPDGMSKLEGLLWCLGEALPKTERMQELIQPGITTLREVHERLTRFPYLGVFMAYEIVTDARHVLLREAPDIFRWASPGPGAARGLGRIIAGDPNLYQYNRRRDAEALQEGMRTLLDRSRSSEFWPQEWPAWEMREVEHTLCEFDKFERVRLGEGAPRQRYNGQGR